MDGPLIVTLTLDPAAQAHFDALRTRYFPPERLLVGAHVTMFHALPPLCAPRLLQECRALCDATAAFTIGVKSLRFLGRGVAYDLAAPLAVGLRERLATHFAADLTPQDSARWSPHITIQNKVSPVVARATMVALSEEPQPEKIFGTGLGVWHYAGGPWRSLEDLPFRGCS